MWRDHARATLAARVAPREHLLRPRNLRASSHFFESVMSLTHFPRGERTLCVRVNLPWVTLLQVCVPTDTGVHINALSCGFLQNTCAALMTVHAAWSMFLTGGNFGLTRCGRDSQNHTNKTMRLGTETIARLAYGSIHHKRPALGDTGRLRRTPASLHRGQQACPSQPFPHPDPWQEHNCPWPGQQDEQAPPGPGPARSESGA